MKFEAAQLLLASVGGWLGNALEDLSGKKGGIVLLSSVAVLSVGGTLGVVGLAGDWQDLPDRVTVVEERQDTTLGPRVDTLESWRLRHTEQVSEPGIERIEALEERQDSMAADVGFIREMTFQMYCADFPDRCEEVPR